MGSFLGKVVRVGLNAVTPKYSHGWASPTNKGLSKLINGTQKDVGNGVIRFQYGLKHAAVRAGYNESLHKYHDLAISAFSSPEQTLPQVFFPQRLACRIRRELTSRCIS